MAEGEQDPNPIEQLVELFIYAPIGLLYEYEDVLPKLIRRGRSQVKLARVLGQMAVKGRQNDPGAIVGDVAGLAATGLAKVITELGAQIGLAPKPDGGDASTPAEETPAGRSSAAPKPAPAKDKTTEAAKAADVKPTKPAAKSEPKPKSPVGPASTPLPIAGYDELTARQIVALLDELSATQRDRIQAHEEAGRNRKTVLAKLDRLAT